jgi:phosphoglycolate phosphatase-like HAD superfamily hydrolase
MPQHCPSPSPNGTLTAPAPEHNVIRHIFWDWNGTLTDDAALLHQAVNTAMTAVGHPRVSAEELRVRFARPLSALFGRLTDERCQDKWPAWHAAFIAAAHSGTEPVVTADALAALQHWHAAGRTQSVLSRWPADDLPAQVAATALLPYLDGIRGASWPEEPKEDMFRRELALRKLDPAQALLIGDTCDDVAAARVVGAAVILCDAHSFAPVRNETNERWRVPRAQSLRAAVDLALAM